MAKGYSERKMEIIDEIDIGHINGWQGRTLAQTYSYDRGPVSVRVIMEGETKRGKAYQSKIMGGVPVMIFAEKILPNLIELCMTARSDYEPSKERLNVIRADIKKTLRLP